MDLPPYDPRTTEVEDQRKSRGLQVLLETLRGMAIMARDESDYRNRQVFNAQKPIRSFDGHTYDSLNDYIMKRPAQRGRQIGHLPTLGGY